MLPMLNLTCLNKSFSGAEQRKFECSPVYVRFIQKNTSSLSFVLLLLLLLLILLPLFKFVFFLVVLFVHVVKVVLVLMLLAKLLVADVLWSRRGTISQILLAVVMLMKEGIRLIQIQRLFHESVLVPVVLKKNAKDIHLME
jgi:hypothetical protein